MLLRSALLGITLFGIFWTEPALAGSSFLSPEYKKPQQQKDPRRTTAPLHRRGAEGFWDPDGAGAEDRNSAEIKFNVPFEIGVKITKEEYQEYGQALEKMLGDMREENAKETHLKN